MRIPIFSRKGVLWGRSLGKVLRESQGKGVFFVIANTRDRGYIFFLRGSGDGEWV